MTTKNTDRGSLVYDKLLQALDYKGYSSKGNREGKCMIPDYSPNNIKRLILSPDGAYIFYHVKVDGKTHSRVIFNAHDLVSAYASSDYKPMLSVLGSRAYFNIEEIIILTQSRTGVQLDYRDTDISVLLNAVHKTSKATGSAEEIVSKRLSRLHYFTVCDNLPLNVLINKITTSKPNCDFYSELPDIANIARINTFNSNWYENYDFSETHYIMDKKDGELRNRLIQIKNEKLKQLKKENVDKQMAEKNATAVKEFKQKFEAYSSCLSVLQKLQSAVKSCGLNNVVQNMTYVDYKPIELYDCTGLPSNYPMKKIDEGMSEGKRLAYNIGVLRTGKQEIVSSISSNLINSLYALSNTSPYTLKTIFKVLDGHVIAVPKSMQSQADHIEQVTGKKLEGVVTDACIPNACWLYYTCFVDSGSPNFKSEFLNRQRWEGLLK